jgi:sRNA-binding regulator protein Hfq
MIICANRRQRVLVKIFLTGIIELQKGVTTFDDISTATKRVGKKKIEDNLKILTTV